MAVLLKSLKLIQKDTVGNPSNYSYDGKKISPYDGDESGFSEVVDCSGWFGSAGWIDLRCGVGEPGHEYQETLESLDQTLQYAGFTQAVLLPNTSPVIQSKNEVSFIKDKARNFLTNLHVHAAVTKDTLGEDLTEILDIHHHGVTVFGDGNVPLSNSDRMMKVLQYLQKFDGVLFDQSYDPLLAIFGQMHEGYTSTSLGMKGIPSLAEEVAIQKNIEILKYTGGNIHFQTVSTRSGVSAIRKAKAEGLNVTADVSLYQLLFVDEDLGNYDSTLKVMPPFREEIDQEALLEGLKDGTIDAIVSNHQPRDYDAKHMEFDLAEFGMSGLQSFLPGMVSLEAKLGWPLLIEKITSGPARIIRAQEEKEMTSLTVFDPSEEWIFNKQSNKSLSANSPFFNKQLKGKVKLVINKDKIARLDD
ncbi:dihydroorotase [Echinicola strongylocentroti]|uniref:Dihydroorotase n=1 Tax=Echinicola strongylocentroti TaxID=1795355 RepID=A0A2Z4IFU7_9BACT|nr:dihydroorotase [Echinicola strongylocentroti]AWW29755.1 dihydroorotase [Echinicola strongylocentroti]